MVLVNCLEYSNQVSDTALDSPSCGTSLNGGASKSMLIKTRTITEALKSTVDSENLA